MTQIAEGLEWKRIYYVNGPEPARMRSSNPQAIKDPPCNGWQHAIVIVGEKRSTIFCPYSFDSWSVRNDCGELAGAKDADFRPDWFAEHMARKWAELQGYGWQKDYDTAALVLKRMDLPVPEAVMKGGVEDTRVKGGKEVSTKLAKPVKLKGKRGKFLAWFLEGDGSRSIREAMAEFSMTRSNALSYLYMLQKDHGIGYALVGDTATVTLPEGCSNPFDEPWGSEAGKEVEPAEEEDDSWLD